MNFKRLIGLIAVKDAQVVKSYGYSFWRPGGDLATCLRNLDRWLVDEIAIVDISRGGVLDERVLETIRRTPISTPLVYGGGIRSEVDVQRLLRVGCDRFIVEELAMEPNDSLQEIADMVGVQALTASVPVGLTLGGRLRLSTSHMQFAPDWVASLDGAQAIERLAQLPVAEVMLIDAAAEGFVGSFSLGPMLQGPLLESLGRGVIWFGGLGQDQAAHLLSHPATVAVAIGNGNLERELAFGDLRKRLSRGTRTNLVRSVRR